MSLHILCLIIGEHSVPFIYNDFFSLLYSNPLKISNETNCEGSISLNLVSLDL